MPFVKCIPKYFMLFEVTVTGNLKNFTFQIFAQEKEINTLTL